MKKPAGFHLLGVFAAILILRPACSFNLLAPTGTATLTPTPAVTATATPMPAMATHTPTFTATATLAPTPTFTATAQPTQASAPELFEGRWTAAFTLEIDTHLQKIERPWFTFILELDQQGNTAIGTLQGKDIEVGGVLQGTVDNKGVFHGTMRLHWDNHNWESLALSLFPDGTSGLGTAVFRAAPDEIHFYSINLLSAP